MGINMTTITQIINNNFVDIHSHIIYGVDDGAKTKMESMKYLDEALAQGIHSIVCTPHICHGDIEKIERIKRNFLDIRDYADSIGIKLYLGTEILMTSKTFELLKRRRLRSLDGKEYVLVEFKRNEDMDIDNLIYMLEELMDIGYTPILAHPELYINYRNISYIKKIKESGVLLQLDATSICKKTSTMKIYNFSKKLLKEKLIDFVASDMHCNEKRNYVAYSESYKIISKKYGKDYADLLFIENPKQVLNINN